MQQEVAHEFVGPQRHRLVAAPCGGPVVLPTKDDDAPFVQRDEPQVRDRHPLSGVAGKVGLDSANGSHGELRFESGRLPPSRHQAIRPT